MIGFYSEAQIKSIAKKQHIPATGSKLKKTKFKALRTIIQARLPSFYVKPTIRSPQLSETLLEDQPPTPTHTPTQTHTHTHTKWISPFYDTSSTIKIRERISITLFGTMVGQLLWTQHGRKKIKKDSTTYEKRAVIEHSLNIEKTNLRSSSHWNSALIERSLNIEKTISVLPFLHKTSKLDSVIQAKITH